MAGKSNIEWTGHTWNPLAGCSVLTPGCTNCYAMKMAARLDAMGQPLYKGLTKPSKAGPVWTGVMRRASDDVLLAPLKRKKPTTYFVNSMSDLFHENVPDEDIDQVFAVMALTPHHTYQVLTKRAERMRDYFGSSMMERCQRVMLAACEFEGGTTFTAADLWTMWPLPNVWLGVSTERQKEADERIPLLLQTPAAVRFISAEPLLGAISLKPWVYQWGCSCGWGGAHGADLCEECGEVFDGGSSETDCVNCPKCGVATNSSACPECKYGADYGPNNSRLDWVITGGESGPNARPSHPDWFRQIRDACAAAGVAYFHKQNGEWLSVYDRDHDDPDWRRCDVVKNETPRGQWLNIEGGQGFHNERVIRVERVGKKAAGRLLDGITHDAMPGRP